MNSGTLEVFDIVRLKEVTCVTMRCKRQRCCRLLPLHYTCVYGGEQRFTGKPGSALGACAWRWEPCGGSASRCQREKQKKGCQHFLMFSPNWLCGEKSRLLFLATPEVEGHFPKTWLNVVDAGLSSESRGCSCRSSVAQPWLKPTQH